MLTDNTTALPDLETTKTSRPGWLRWALTIALVAVGVAVVFSATLTGGVGREFLLQRLQTFVTIFLGIFIEAAPFLLAGSIVSGFIAVFVDQSMIERYLPKRALPAAFSGALMGMIFPVCECGVVPVTRRLYEKGLPMSVGVGFLLAAPAVNPIVILSTFAAFGWGPVLWGRVLGSIAVATVIAWVFHLAQPKEVLLPEVCAARDEAACAIERGPQHHLPVGQRVHQALITAGDDFIDMARYLIMGSLLAAMMQTLVPQTALLSIGQGPLVSVIALQALAFVLSICSTVDAFVALAFAGTFTTGAVVSFLTFGPMVDVKSSLMFMGVFRRRTVGYLILLPWLLTLLLGVFWNLNIGN